MKGWTGSSIRAAALSSASSPPARSPGEAASSREHGRRPADHHHPDRPPDPAERRTRLLQGGRKPLRSEPNHQAADGLQVQDRGGAKARNRGGHVRRRFGFAERVHVRACPLVMGRQVGEGGSRITRFMGPPPLPPPPHHPPPAGPLPRAE